jgi:hypothetical protein
MTYIATVAETLWESCRLNIRHAPQNVIPSIVDRPERFTAHLMNVVCRTSDVVCRMSGVGYQMLDVDVRCSDFESQPPPCKTLPPGRSRHCHRSAGLRPGTNKEIPINSPDRRSALQTPQNFGGSVRIRLFHPQSSGLSPLGAIFTNLGSNCPSTVTRSRCAAITSWMFLYAIGTSSNPALDSLDRTKLIRNSRRTYRSTH